MKINCKILLFSVLMSFPMAWADQPNLLEKAKEHMDYMLEKKNKKFVIGISVKTTNENMKSAQDIPPLCSRFYGENLSAKIPNRVDQNILVVYTQYESDYMKPYTCVVGCEVSSLKEVPPGMVGIEIPAHDYAVFTTKGPFPQSVVQAWQGIWSSTMKRSYTADFEVYGPDFNPQTKPEVKIYLAIKN